MSHVEHARVRQGEWLLAAIGLLASLLVSCSRAESVEVRVSAPPQATAVTPAGPGASFQGAVTEIDLEREELGVGVRIEWTPVLKAVREDRRVAVGPETRWEPAGAGLAMLHAGDEVQVDAVSRPDGTWRARQVQLFDID